MVELAHQPGHPPAMHFLASVPPETPDMTAGHGRDCVRVACTTHPNRCIGSCEPTRGLSP
jgi:hypothetical protein